MDSQLKALELNELLNAAIGAHQAGDFSRAEGLYREIISRDPGNADAVHLLGVVAGQSGRTAESVELISRAIGLRPHFAEAMGNLANALRDQGLLDEPIAWYRKAIALMPDFAEAHNNLGNALRSRGDVDEAIACYRQAIAMMPEFVTAHRNLAAALLQRSDIDGSIDSWRKAIALSPDSADAHSQLSAALRMRGDLGEAIAAARKAIALNPRDWRAHTILGNALKDSGCMDEAIGEYRQSMLCDEKQPAPMSNIILALHYQPSSTARTIFAECARWADRYAAAPQGAVKSHGNPRDPGRRLKIGYVSPDFKLHAVAFFFLPLLLRHDRAGFEVYCYAQVSASDRTTAYLRKHADHWRNICGMTDPQAARMIREDQIDILIDLALHTADNRLGVFALKPAPVQVTYLAYCSTSGMKAIDYRLTDPQLDPPGDGLEYYSEESVYLPETYWCYQPPVATPDPTAPPAMSAGSPGSPGYVTFGNLNNFCKASATAVETWCELLRSVPNSRIVLYAKQGSHRQRLLEEMAARGVDASRVRFEGLQGLGKYFAVYQGIDIGLDPFPYNGGTTTCDALWMGVPVVTLAGATAVGRAGAILLTNVGLPELIARTPAEYVKIAKDLAGDLPRLAGLRRSLRRRMLASPLMDAPRFARNIESAYRAMWKRWCEREQEKF
jgi:predicted O-linked N-acetylglucosamine transferase (SPINDLY family)